MVALCYCNMVEKELKRVYLCNTNVFDQFREKYDVYKDLLVHAIQVHHDAIVKCHKSKKNSLIIKIDTPCQRRIRTKAG